MLILEPCCLSRHRDGYTDQTDRPAINSLEHARHKDLGLLPASSISSFHFLLHDLRGSVQKPPVSREETLAHYWPWSVGKVRDEHLFSCLVLVFRMTGDTHFLSTSCQQNIVCVTNDYYTYYASFQTTACLIIPRRLSSSYKPVSIW